MKPFRRDIENCWGNQSQSGPHSLKNWVPGYIPTDYLKQIQRFSKKLLNDYILRYSFIDVYLLNQPFYVDTKLNQNSSIYRCISTCFLGSEEKDVDTHAKRNNMKGIKTFISNLKDIGTLPNKKKDPENVRHWGYFRYFLMSTISDSFNSISREKYNFYANADVINTYHKFLEKNSEVRGYIGDIFFGDIKYEFLNNYKNVSKETYGKMKSVNQIISCKKLSKSIDNITVSFLDFLLKNINKIDLGFLSYMFNQCADIFYPWGTSMSIPESNFDISIKYPQEIIKKPDFYKEINLFAYKNCIKKYDKVLRKYKVKNIYSLVVIPFYCNVGQNLKTKGFMRFFNRLDDNNSVITEQGYIETAVNSDAKKMRELIKFLNCKLSKHFFGDEITTMNEIIDPNMRRRSFKMISGWYKKFNFDLEKEIINEKSSKILDVGCGTGQFIKTLNESLENKGKTNTKVKLHGIDLQVEIEDNVDNITIFDGDFSTYEFNTKYNLINAMSVIAYMNDGIGAIEKIFNLLEINGVAAIYLLRKDRDICYDLDKVIKNINESNQNIGTFEIKNFVEGSYDENRHFYEDSCLLIIRKKKNKTMDNPYKYITSFRSMKNKTEKPSDERLFEAYIKTGIYKNEEDSIMPFYDLNESDYALLQKTIADGFEDIGIHHLVSRNLLNERFKHIESKHISFDKKQYDQLITFLRESGDPELANLAKCIEENLAKRTKEKP